MPTRKIISIDRDLCNGCGLCVGACAEGALVLDDEDKATLVRDIYCDGMGDCLNVCPTGALRIIEHETADYDPEAAREHVIHTRGEDAAAAVHPGPSSANAPAPSELDQWPIQLHLISPQSPNFRGADLLVAADCTAFTRGSFHADLLRGRQLVIACPKLDNTGPYVEKLAELIRINGLKSLTLAIMTVPCCSGLLRLVEQAVTLSGIKIPIKTVMVGLDGEIVLES